MDRVFFFIPNLISLFLDTLKWGGYSSIGQYSQIRTRLEYLLEYVIYVCIFFFEFNMWSEGTWTIDLLVEDMTRLAMNVFILEEMESKIWMI